MSSAQRQARAGETALRPRTVPSVLRRSAARFPDREAVVDGDVRITYAQLHERSRACARLFVAEGVRPGDRVAVCVPNSFHWVEAALGALYIGATLVPINTRYTGTEIADILHRTGATGLVVVGPFLGVDRLAAVAASEQGLPETLRCVLRAPDWDTVPVRGAGIDDSTLDAFADAVTPDTRSDIVFTSGTSGRSKGALGTHGQALDSARVWAELVGLSETDRYLVINPFFHIFGYKAGILAAIQCGTALYPQQTFQVDEAMRIIERERITVLPGVPTIHQSLLDHPDRGRFDLSSLRAATTGAATVPVVLVERMRAELYDVVLTAYGLSEATVVTMCRADDTAETIATTSGRAVPGMEVRIGVAGEIEVRGSAVTRGYFDDPDATAAAFDADGWFRTGDAGVVDDRGYLRITDRIKDMYTTGGFNVYPAEIEQVIARLPGVSESAVVGVPDPRLGEVGRAHIVLVPGYELTADEVRAHCAVTLAGFKVPREYVFTRSLPRNATGKVLKRVLRERDSTSKENR